METRQIAHIVDNKELKIFNLLREKIWIQYPEGIASDEIWEMVADLMQPKARPRPMPNLFIKQNFYDQNFTY